MRHIKFRAWDKKENKWVGEMDYSILLNGIIIDKNEADYYSKNLELMQFTGLLDENGKEIYEGDILQWGFSHEIARKEVIFKDGCFVFQFKGLHADSYQPIYKYLTSDNFEVIGNIYENSNLLPN